LKFSPIHALAAFALVTPLAASHAASNVSAADRAFIAMVSQGGMFEVKAGAVGATQGSTQDIKDQGTTEAHDHQLVGDKLKSIAASVGITFPATLKPAFQKELNDLKAATGPAFDALYLKDMEDVHAKDGAAFAKEAADGTNPDLRAFAAETHRIVLRHIGELKAIGAAS
jgi:putative membrane protein